ncbi:MAG TPA: prolyl oligopeptidase family serine peptidase [Gemmataceae bacterium]|nr:prolyl oligopeptidase family serine peptidase [Gemmataceae bacterium]
MRYLALVVVLVVVPAASAAPPAERGTVHFSPLGDQHNVPARYRLEDHTFPWELTWKRDLPGIDVDVFVLRYPSPVESPCPENNTVYAEYYRPRGPGPFPGVIILDITAGDQMVSRSIAAYLAQNRIAGLFVQMAYYGPRRPPGSKLRLLSPNVKRSLEAVRQTVLDLRRAAAWMESRPELDARRLGILGTSLGSFIGALTAEMEPRLGRVAVLLGGGGLVDAYYDHPQARLARLAYEALGGSKEKLAHLIAPADPLTCAANLKGHKLLMLAGRRDDVVPPRMAEALWQASGRQKIVWYDCTHLGAVKYIVPAMGEVVRHFGAP